MPTLKTQVVILQTAELGLTIRTVPPSTPSARRWNISMKGNSHTELRIPCPKNELSAHSQNDIRSELRDIPGEPPTGVAKNTRSPVRRRQSLPTTPEKRRLRLWPFLAFQRQSPTQPSCGPRSH